MYEIGAREIIEKILPVVDNFERGLAAVPEEEKDSRLTLSLIFFGKLYTYKYEILGNTILITKFRKW